MARGPAWLPEAIEETESIAFYIERDSGLVGTSLGLMNLLLACHSRGLGASAMTGPLLAEAKLKSLLEVPASWGIVALVPLGYPAEEPAPTERKQVDKVTRWIR